MVDHTDIPSMCRRLLDTGVLSKYIIALAVWQFMNHNQCWPDATVECVEATLKWVEHFINKTYLKTMYETVMGVSMCMGMGMGPTMAVMCACSPLHAE